MAPIRIEVCDNVSRMTLDDKTPWSSDRLRERLRALHERDVAAGRTVGIQLYVSRDGDVLVDDALGVRHPDGGAMTTRTRVPVYSTSKAVTATALHVLVEDGALAWHDPVARYVPAFAAHGKGGVTVQHLLTHAAGLALPEQDVPPATWWDWDAAVAAVCELTPFAPPGTTAAYTVLAGHQVLGQVVQVVGAAPFAQVVEDLVLGPLGMDRTGWGRAADAEDVSDVVGVDADRQAVCDRWGSGAALTAVLPSIGLHSCARDVGRLLESWLSDLAPTRALLSPATLRTARSLIAPVTASTGFGLGWLVGTDVGAPGSRGALAGPRSFGHPGMCSTQAWADPDTGVVFVAVANTDCGQAESDRRFALLGDAVCRATS